MFKVGLNLENGINPGDILKNKKFGLTLRIKKIEKGFVYFTYLNTRVDSRFLIESFEKTINNGLWKKEVSGKLNLTSI